MFDLIIIGAMFVYLCSLIGYHIDCAQYIAAVIVGIFAALDLYLFWEHFVEFRKRLKERVKEASEKIKDVFDKDEDNGEV